MNARPAENDATALEQAWMEGAFHYGGDAAEQWYFNEGGAEANPYRPISPASWGEGLTCSVCGDLWTTCWATRRHRVTPPASSDGAS